MKRIIALSFLMLAAVAACAQVKYVAGYYSSDGTGHVGTFNPMTGSGGAASPTLVPLKVGLMYSTDGTGNVGTWAFCTATCFGSSSGGSVTSVTFTGDGTIFSSTPSAAVTTTGTLPATLLTQLANVILAGPTTGSAAAPTFRALVVADIPSLSGTYLPLAGGTLIGTLIGTKVQLGAQAGGAGAQTVPLAITTVSNATVTGYVNTASPNTVLAYYGGQAYTGGAASFGGMQVLTDSTTWYKGALAFLVNSVDGSDPSQVPTERMRIAQTGDVLI
jgi:hypothetical protein